MLLLSSLLDTLFGTSVSKSEIENGWDGRSVKIQYEKYPELVSLLKKLLDYRNDAGGMNESKFVIPALDIIRRAGPPAGDTTQLFLHVTAHLGSPDWHIREMAGRALCALTMGEDIGIRVTELLTNSRENANLRHGALHAARCIIERRAALDPLDVVRRSNQIHQAWVKEDSFESSRPLNPPIRAELNKVKIALLTATLDSSVVPPSFGFLSHRSYSDLVFHTFNAFKESFQVLQTYLHLFLLMAALNGKYEWVQEISDRAVTILDVDVILEMLKILPKILNSDTDLTRIVQIYGNIYVRYNHPEICSVVLSQLLKSLEAKFVIGCPHHDIHRTLLNIQSCSGKFADSPLFLNNWINFMGWVMLFDISNIQSKNVRPHFQLPSQFLSWVDILRTSGKATEVSYLSKQQQLKKKCAN